MFIQILPVNLVLNTIPTVASFCEKKKKKQTKKRTECKFDMYGFLAPNVCSTSLGLQQPADFRANWKYYIFASGWSSIVAFFCNFPKKCAVLYGMTHDKHIFHWSCLSFYPWVVQIRMLLHLFCIVTIFFDRFGFRQIIWSRLAK